MPADPRALLATADAPAEEATEPLWPVLAVTVVLAACSLVYELLAAQTLSILAANTVVWYSLTVGIFLLAMGTGAFLSRRVGNGRTPWEGLFRLEIGLTALGLAVVPAIHLGHMVYAYLSLNRHETAGLLAFFGTAFVVVFAVGTLTGIEMPLLMRIARERESGAEDSRETANTVLGADYLGSLAGAVAFPLVLLPRLGLFEIGILTAAENLAVALYLLLFVLRGRTPVVNKYWLVGILGGALVLCGAGVGRAQQYFLRKFYYYHQTGESLGDLFGPMGRFPEVYRQRSPYQRIDIVKDVAPDFMSSLMPAWSTKLKEVPDYPQDWILFLNGDFQTNTTFDEVYHEFFAHVPVAATGRVPREVLVLGGGDGLLVRELTKYEGVESITHVDIDPVLVALARRHPVLVKANGGAMLDERVHTVLGDGYQFVRNARRKWDAIYIDFPAAVDYDLAKLYSREFFTFVRRRVAPGGWVVFDATGLGIVSRPRPGRAQRPEPGNDWPVYYNTLRKAGFGTIVPYLTSLERAEDRAAEVLNEAEVTIGVSPQYAILLQNAKTKEEKEALTRTIIRELVGVHIYMLQQGFIMMAPDESPFTRQWHDPGVPLHLLNEERFGLAFKVRFPRSEEIDEDLVNSILRPTFPTTSVWSPRVPY